MKRIIVCLLAMALLLTGCGGGAQSQETTAEPTTVATEPITEPTTEPTTVPTEPEVYFNPLNGEILDEPYTGRVFAHVITNTKDALPHVSANEADIIIESYVSRGVVRNLGLFTNIQEVKAIGATRSTRLITNQIAGCYDAVLIHAGGFDMVLEDADYRQLDHFNIDSLYRQANELAKKVAYRDKEYKRYAPNDLFSSPADVVKYVEAQGVRTTQPADKEYFLSFVDDATPVNGEIADEITITYGQKTKTTTMIYDETTGKYNYKQYGEIMHDQITGEVESFNNVIIMDANLYEDYIYQAAVFPDGGRGYFACGGKIIPINWECDNEQSPFRFLTEDGEILNINRGNTYIGIIGSLSKQLEWADVIPPETEPPVETTVETVPETTAETVAETVAETTAETTAETVAETTAPAAAD